MGFGWFLIGYFFVSVMSLYSSLSFAMLAGYPMMIFALRQLAPYHRYFRVGFYVSILSLPFAVYFGLYGLSELGLVSLSALGGVLSDTVQWVYFVFTLLFTALWLYGIMDFCREIGHLRLQGCALRNLMLFGITYLFDFIARLPIGFVQRYQGYFAAPVLLMRIIVIYLNLYLIFSCYRAFGPEGEELSKNKRKEEGK